MKLAWADPEPGVVPFQQVADQAGFACGVLPDEQHHGLGVKVRVVERSGDKVMVVVSLFQWHKLSFVHLFEALPYRRVELGLFRLFLEERGHIVDLFLLDSLISLTDSFFFSVQIKF